MRMGRREEEMTTGEDMTAEWCNDSRNPLLSVDNIMAAAIASTKPSLLFPIHMVPAGTSERVDPALNLESQA
jgi:hypothetical protein